MVEKSIKKPGGRSGLSADKIFAAAVRLADESGLEGLSMRRLAQTLGVEAMSLYNHVKNKDALLDGMIEEVATGFHRAGSGDWQAEMRQRALSAHEVLTAHPWASALLVSRVTAGPVMLTYADATLGCLRGAGFSWAQADRIWNALDSHIYGFTLLEQNFPFNEDEYAPAARAYLPMIPADVLPNLRALTVEVAEERHAGRQEFTFGLDLLLGAMARLPREG
ncbi:TetR/AcrR family transcriptional regulator C-terminal domain-containing protein [Thalassococcus sp. BH17M4-6]|uniref:TetR/AcrR family transcriptional regulator C-terminal domain-containing protein n=1 Tax=Thalassococcus sp. BH17M4-6 TaxID=3413148 RepID=UPI003BDC7A17